MDKNTLIVSDESIKKLAHALNSDLRLKIIHILSKESLNITQLCEYLKIPQSTCTLNIKILQDANIISTKIIPAKKKGIQKVCSLKYGRILLSFNGMSYFSQDTQTFVTEMPVGLFTNYEVFPPCGIVSDSNVIGQFDTPSSFLSPLRAGAGLIWFSYGFIEYRFSKDIYDGKKNIKSITLSIEICSEFPSYNNTWLSDITLWLNDIELGTWTSPADFGGTRGQLTPDWWDINSTQFGLLTNWKISSNGTYVNKDKVSDISIHNLNIDKANAFNFRIGVKENAERRGGINIFGNSFGNFEQGIKLFIEVE